MSDPTSAPTPFNGIARLFPLPDVVLFPHAILPLHIFEPRYRRMTTDALNSDRLITLVLLRPGWEEGYQGRPPIHSMACLGRIFNEQVLEDGRYNIWLRGLHRVRIVQEVADDAPYRSAEVDLMEDLLPPPPDEAAAWRRRLAAVLPRWFPAGSEALTQFERLLQSDLELGPLCDICSFALPLDVEFKQLLLMELRVLPRMLLLVQHLEEHAPNPPAAEHRFPPDFSNN